MDDMAPQNQDDEYIVIPNPIYDVVFRYLMQDTESARIILSTLIDENIKKIDFQPLSFARKATPAEYDEQVELLITRQFERERDRILQDPGLSDLDKRLAISEISIKDPVTGKDLRMLHLDFAAVIEKDDGQEELVMIELQKVAIETDIFRFKHYIAENFLKKRKARRIDPDTGQEVEEELPYRLIPIFILNFAIEDDIRDLVVRTRQVKSGIFTGKGIDAPNEFIDNLSYELFVVQLPYLREAEKAGPGTDPHRRQLLSLLKLFDQGARKTDNQYRLRLFRRMFPGFLDRVIRRLQSADIDNPDLEKQMQAEDFFLRPLLQRDNKIAWLKMHKKEIESQLKEKEKELRKTAKALQQKDKALEQKDKALEQKDKVLADTAKELEQKDKVLADTAKALEEQRRTILNMARLLKASGLSDQEIHHQTGLPIDQIEGL